MSLFQMSIFRDDITVQEFLSLDFQDEFHQSLVKIRTFPAAVHHICKNPQRISAN